MAHATHGVRERIREVLLALRRLVGCDRHCAVFREEIGLAKRFKGQKGDVMYSQLIDARQRRPRRVPCRQKSLAGFRPSSGTALRGGGSARVRGWADGDWDVHDRGAVLSIFQLVEASEQIGEE